MTELCGNVMPGAREGIEPCPLDKGHEEEHVYFTQSAPPTKKRGRNGVWIYAEDGTALMHMDFDGYMQPAEIGAMAVYLQWAAKQGKP